MILLNCKIKLTNKKRTRNELMALIKAKTAKKLN